MLRFRPETWVLIGFLLLALSAAFFSLSKWNIERVAEWLIPSKPWVTFDIPKEPQRLQGSFRTDAHAITVCNGSMVDWKGITLRVAGTYNAQYYAKLRILKSHLCETTSYSEFAEPSWKKMQMPPNAFATRADLLTSDPVRGYAELQEVDARR